jgi:hypothetical protein
MGPPPKLPAFLGCGNSLATRHSLFVLYDPQFPSQRIALWLRPRAQGDPRSLNGQWSESELVFVDGTVGHQVSGIGSVLHLRNDRYWTDPLHSTDVNQDGMTTPVDALRVINRLARISRMGSVNVLPVREPENFVEDFLRQWRQLDHTFRCIAGCLFLKPTHTGNGTRKWRRRRKKRRKRTSSLVRAGGNL